MGLIPSDERSQQLLLPDAVDDYVGPDNPVRFIDAFVSGLDLAEVGFKRVLPESMRRPGYGQGHGQASTCQIRVDHIRAG